VKVNTTWSTLPLSTYCTDKVPTVYVGDKVGIQRNVTGVDSSNEDEVATVNYLLHEHSGRAAEIAN
jgi:hypothetical protein